VPGAGGGLSGFKRQALGQTLAPLSASRRNTVIGLKLGRGRTHALSVDWNFYSKMVVNWKK
jgi:hypothetical protein